MNKLVSWFKKGDKVIYLVYGALALIILFPLLKSGYIFAMDMVFVSAIIFSYVFLVLLLNDTFLSRGIKEGIKDIKREYLYSILILIFITLLFIWSFNLEAIIFLTLFVAFILYGWDSRVLAGGALIFLVSCPILLIYKKDTLAEQMAIYAYYFLVITVVLQIKEFKNSKIQESEN